MKYERPELELIHGLSGKDQNDQIFANFGGSEFLTLSPLHRAEKIHQFLLLNGSSELEHVTANLPGAGLVVIKPEAQPVKEVILKMIQQLIGVEIVLVRDTRYDVDNYLRIYGNFLGVPSPEVGLTFPSLLYAGVVGTVTAILFKHHQVNDYREIAQKINPELMREVQRESYDTQAVFKKWFVGTGNHHGFALREQIKPFLDWLGFGSMNTSYAKPFDVTEELRMRTPEQNLRTFNGLHSPTNNDECQKQIPIYFTIEQVDRVRSIF